MNDAPHQDPIQNARDWGPVLNTYRESNGARSTVELAVTVAAFGAIWIVMWTSLGLGYLLTLLLAVPAAGFLLRIFLIQHDCGHGAFFRHRGLNDWVGRLLGTLTLTPYDLWRRGHNIHHASSGNLDRRGIGDIDTITVREYLARTQLGRLRYRLYRHPFVMFGLGPAFLFLLQHRLPVGFMRKGWEPWLATMLTNAATGVLVAGMIWLVGIGPFLLVHLPITLLAASIGVWLFYVQHQFEETSWSKGSDWDMHEAALHGSSFYDLPPVLRWFTANIGMHHVHHLCSRIPFYRLPEVLRDHPQLADTGRLTLLESLSSVRLVLWDEDRRQLVSFNDVQRSLD